MMVRGRTVAILLIIAIFTSSYLTFAIIDGNSLADAIPNPTTGNDNADSSTTADKYPKEMEKLNDVYQKILSTYIKKENSEDLIDGAIRGMVQSLDDPHSTYMDAKEAKDFFSTLSDSFEGIGAEVTMENGRVTVVAPIKDSPSEKAGIRPKDQIIKVNGDNLEGLGLFEAVNKIRGPKGTKATLEIVRPGLKDPITVTVIRDEIPIETVHSSSLSTNKGLIGIIEISNFGEKTAEEFKTALKKLEKAGIKGLIIDVRGNPGGYLQSILEIGNFVIPNQGIIVQIEDRNQEKRVYKSEMKETKYPIVGLIDGGSASASEILAGALQESGKYPIVGEPSYGKGTVQNPFELSDGSNIKLTVAKWLTPNGNWIHEKGVQPDINVSLPDYFKAMPFPENVELKLDMNNVDVQNLQIILNGIGYKTKRKDGYFDDSTKLAVKSFQKANNIDATGIVDSKTATLLQNKVVERIKEPKNDTQLQVATETLLKLIK